MKKLLSQFKKASASSAVIAGARHLSSKKEAAKVIETLIKSGFLVDPQKNEKAVLLKEVAQEIGARKVELGEKTFFNALRIVLTESCPFQCKYCFVKNNQGLSRKDLTWTLLKKAIDLLVKINRGKSIELQFFGGEPMMRFEMIERAVKYLQKLVSDGKIEKVYYGITTNAALVDEKKAAFLRQNNFLVSVSLDGWQKLNDLNRVFANKRGTYKATLRGLETLRKHDNEIGILVTPSASNIKSLARACRFIIEKLGYKFITINTPQPVNGNWEVDGRAFSNQLKKCLLVAEELGAVINHFGTRNLFALNEQKPMTLSCSKFGNDYTMTLRPDGRLSPCIVSWQHQEMLEKMDHFNFRGKIGQWKLAPPYSMGKCLDCPAMNVCGGPCPLEIFEIKKYGKPFAHERCRFFADFLQWAIWHEQ